jgi:hypothetical protein
VVLGYVPPEGLAPAPGCPEATGARQGVHRLRVPELRGPLPRRAKMRGLQHLVHQGGPWGPVPPLRRTSGHLGSFRRRPVRSSPPESTWPAVSAPVRAGPARWASVLAPWGSPTGSPLGGLVPPAQRAERAARQQEREEDTYPTLSVKTNRGGWVNFQPLEVGQISAGIDMQFYQPGAAYVPARPYGAPRSLDRAEKEGERPAPSTQ